MCIYINKDTAPALDRRNCTQCGVGGRKKEKKNETKEALKHNRELHINDDAQNLNNNRGRKVARADVHICIRKQEFG